MIVLILFKNPVPYKKKRKIVNVQTMKQVMIIYADYEAGDDYLYRLFFNFFCWFNW